MRVVFFGSSSFSVPCLRAVLPYTACAVTKRSRPQGRGYQLADNEVKKAASVKGIPVIEIDSFKDAAADRVGDYNPDVLLVASFGLIIPQRVLDVPTIGPVNVHPSLLPQYRGASPLQSAIWNGESQTGITLIKMNDRMDAGDILYQEKADIFPEDNAVTLSDRLATRSGEILSDFFDRVKREGVLHGAPQDHDRATYSPIITKEMGRIEWSAGALAITRQIKALVAWPTAYTYIDGLMLKVFDGEIHVADASGEKGRISGIDRRGFIVETPRGSLLVKEVQLQNKKRMSAWQFSQGYRNLIGKSLG